jgi:hypothetical protein
MGKNQAYKAMQRAKMGTSTAAGGPGEEIDDGMVCILPRLMLGSFSFPAVPGSWLLNVFACEDGHCVGLSRGNPNAEQQE